MILTINSQVTENEWENFQLAQELPPFLQSWHMQKMYADLGEKTIPLGIWEGHKLCGIALIIVIHARRGNHLYLPYGPVILNEYWQLALPVLTNYLKILARQEKVDFVRCAPFITDTLEHRAWFAASRWKPAPTHILAEHLWLLNIAVDAAEILKNMRKTMRQLIRRGEQLERQQQLQIEMRNDPEAVEEFIKLHRTTVSRHKFVPYTDIFFRAQVKAFAPQQEAQIFLARAQHQYLAGAIIMYYGNMASYHHGASLSNNENKIPTSYLLQWRAISEAQRRRCQIYNFWGIVPPDTYISPLWGRRHPMMGLSQFKKGFGGYEYNLLHCHDLPLTPKYQLTRIIEGVRRRKRGYFKYHRSILKQPAIST